MSVKGRIKMSLQLTQEDKIKAQVQLYKLNAFNARLTKIDLSVRVDCNQAHEC